VTVIASTSARNGAFFASPNPVRRIQKAISGGSNACRERPKQVSPPEGY
jgi:hypothetical protein